MIKAIEEEYGEDAMDLCQAAIMDSCCPGVCRECGAVYEYEPDQGKGWCDNCEKNTVVSLLLLEGLI